MTAAESSFRIICALRSRYDTRPLTARELGDLVSRSAGAGGVTDFYISHDAPEGGIPSRDLAEAVLSHGGRPLVSVSCAARPREAVLEGMESLQEAGVREVLLVTGDYPRSRPPEHSGHLFDLDSLQLLMLLRESGVPAGALKKGCVVSPFKDLEAEVRWQYARLVRKVEFGADFIVSQAGHDPRRWDELIRLCRLLGLERPVIGHVLVPDAALAALADRGRLPGAALPPPLADRRIAADGQEEGDLRHAARAVAALRGMGYQGVLLGGRRLTHDTLGRILEESERIAPRWREFLEPRDGESGRFYYFRPGAGAGLNSDTPAEVSPRRRRHPAYVLSYLVDYFAFGSWGPAFSLLVRVCRFCDRHPFWGKALWALEYLAKAPLYRCRMCGDCTLYACGFLCCESACPKRMVNGPCGGSAGGYCEVGPGKKRCIWVTAYERLKGTAERPSYTAPPIPPRDRALDGTCSWINFCLGRDHRTRRAP